MSKRYTIVRLVKDGERFEILVDPHLALSFKQRRTQLVSETFVSNTVFTDANKGLRASEETLKKAFGTTDAFEIAGFILKKGILQLTTEQRKQLTEEKRRQIISFLSRQSIDPRTNLPHPPLRIEQAMEQIHYSIDPFRDSEEQANEVLKLLLPILPIKLQKITLSVSIPSTYAGKVYGTVKALGKIKHEEWRADGSWMGLIELPAGLYGSFLEELGEKTRGNLKTELIK